MRGCVRINSPVYELEYKKKKFPVRDVFIDRVGAQIIATRELRDELRRNFGKDKECEAETIDQIVFSYVDDLSNIEELLYGCA